METLKNITFIQWLGIVILFNTTLIGGSSQLPDLFLTPVMVKAILALATLGNGFLGGLVTMFGGIRTQAQNITDAGARIAVPPGSNSTLVAMAKDAAVANVVPTVAKVLMVSFALSFLLAGAPAMAQIRLKTPGQIGQDIDNELKKTNAKVADAVAPDPAKPLACTFQMLTKLTPDNLLPTINACTVGKLVADTQRALTSAQAFGGTGKGDADGVNCLTPALAIFQAGLETPAVAEIPAVMNPDGSVKTPAVDAVPAQEPGPILLFQKYREFTLSGALTSCQAWFNGPINATAAAGVAGVGTVAAGAALLVPK